jgi:hypothetical protein
MRCLSKIVRMNDDAVAKYKADQLKLVKAAPTGRLVLSLLAKAS